MEFIVKVEGTDYNVETSQKSKVSYFVNHENKQYEMSLSADNEWVLYNFRHGQYPIPVSAIGEAIQEHFYHRHDI